MQFERNNKGLFIKNLVMSILAFCFLHNNEFVGIIFIIYDFIRNNRHYMPLELFLFHCHRRWNDDNRV